MREIAPLSIPVCPKSSILEIYWRREAVRWIVWVCMECLTAKDIGIELKFKKNKKYGSRFGEYLDSACNSFGIAWEDVRHALCLYERTGKTGKVAAYITRLRGRFGCAMESGDGSVTLEAEHRTALEAVFKDLGGDCGWLDEYYGETGGEPGEFTDRDGYQYESSDCEDGRCRYVPTDSDWNKVAAMRVIAGTLENEEIRVRLSDVLEDYLVE